MTPEQALQVVSDALQPAMQGRITRAGYVAIEQAIKILADAITTQPESTNDLKS